MPSQDFLLPKLSLSFAKIVANPTPISWSQVYSAGSLFVTLSLTQSDASESDEITLPAIGKDIFNNLEAEFFSLEEKKLSTIKAAIEKSFTSLPSNVRLDACLAYFKDDILYILIIGHGKIIMRRDNTIGLLLEKKKISSELANASGYLQPGDLILLQTGHFSQNVSEESIREALKLEHPNDIAESLSPLVHEKEDGSQAAVIIAYNGAIKTHAEVLTDTDREESETSIAPLAEQTASETHHKTNTRHRLLSLRLSRRQQISLVLGIFILILLTAGVFYTKNQQQNAQSQTLYKQVSGQAQKFYDEGIELKSLNQSLAQDDFAKAENTLKDNLNKFEAGSDERTKLEALLHKIESELKPAANTNQIKPTAVEPDENDMLVIENANKALAYSQDDSAVYMLTDTAVAQIDKSNGGKKELLKNADDWKSAVAVSSYLGNIYILDKKEGILKFVAGSGGFGKTAYFTSDAPSLNQSAGMTIDGSVWILTKDGKILKYTRGKADSFQVTGLSVPLSRPSKIYTNTDLDSIYILDNGNSRIVKLSKEGAFQSQYNAELLSQAKDFEIIDDGQKARFLAGEKIYEMPLE